MINGVIKRCDSPQYRAMVAHIHIHIHVLLTYHHYYYSIIHLSVAWSLDVPGT